MVKMPIAIKKMRRGVYQVVNELTGVEGGRFRVHAKGTTLEKARKQKKLLVAIDAALRA